MKTPEEIKKGIECCIIELRCNNCPYANHCRCTNSIGSDVLDYINQLENQLRDATKKVTSAEPAPKWISADNPPKESRREDGAQIPFIVYTEELGITIGFYYPDAQIWESEDIDVEPTYWMHLPEPPKGGT